MKHDKKKDPGLQYMLSLRINPAKNLSGVEDQLARASDRKTAVKIMADIANEYTGGGDRKRDFYSLKNTSYELSFALSSAFDGNILRSACNWIDENKELFGKTILEVGCDIGIMSCYLGETFPDSKIVSIDRCEESIENAKKLAEKRNVKNIEFINTDLEGITQTFDTVFSMRVMHENISISTEEDLVNDLTEQADTFRLAVSNYARQVSEHIADKGNLISFERVGRNALFLGWLEALDERGLILDIEHYQELICQEVGNSSSFQVFATTHNNSSTADKVQIKSGQDDNAYDVYFLACKKYMDFTQREYIGWDAKNAYEYLRGVLIEGYVVEDTRHHTRCKMSLWTHRMNKNECICYVNNGGNAGAKVCGIDEEDSIIESFRSDIEDMKKQSYMKVQTMIS